MNVDPEEGTSLVRPYARTRGRTRSDYDLALEALVTTSGLGLDESALAEPEHQSIAALCRDVRSVAEVAALLSIPLGVARVLVGDMAALGLLTVHPTPSQRTGQPDVAFLERVLDGLRRL
ncbi:MAG: DUF742 domain-containing protein [Geodermatophilaceae bacterium]